MFTLCTVTCSISFLQKYLNEIAFLEQALKEKNKENKRLKENFETMKQANDALKKEVPNYYFQKQMFFRYGQLFFSIDKHEDGRGSYSKVCCLYSF